MMQNMPASAKDIIVCQPRQELFEIFEGTQSKFKLSMEVWLFTCIYLQAHIGRFPRKL